MLFARGMGKHPVTLDDDVLLSKTRVLVKRIVECEADLIAHIAEIDRRKLYRSEACASTLSYCVERLGLSRSMACKRVRLARLSQRLPVVLDWMIAPPYKRIHMSGLIALAPHLTEENADELLARAAGRSKREIEEIVHELLPRPTATAGLRRLPTLPSATSRTPESPRFDVRFTADQALCDDIERARDLLRNEVPSGDLSEVFARALKIAITTLAEQRERGSKVEETTPAVAADVRRAVFERDGGRCTFVDSFGGRCRLTTRLVYQYRASAHGPPSEANLSLRCRAHAGLSTVDDGPAIWSTSAPPERPLNDRPDDRVADP